MAGYTRQSAASIVNGSAITAPPLNAEFTQLVAALAASTGHKHDNQPGEGGYVPLIADADALNKIVVDTSNNKHSVFVEVSSSTVPQMHFQDGAIIPETDNDIDLGSSSVEFKDLYIDGTAHIDTLDVDENAGIIGNLTVTGVSTFNGNTVIGNAASDTVTITADVASDLIPSADNTHDLGGNGTEWKDLWIDGTAHIDVLEVDESATVGTTLTVAGVTALNGGLTMDSNKFTVANTSGNTAIAGTLAVAGATTLAATSFGDANITNVGNIALDSITADGSTITITGNTTFADGAYDFNIASHDTSNGLKLGGTLVTATAAELNILDGVTATFEELNLLDGVTATTDELNIIDGVTATTAELNILDGVTATFEELNKLDGVTATTAELNLIDGVTATTDEINYLDVTTLGTSEASKAVTVNASGDLIVPDSDKFNFGAGSDMVVYHDGSNSYITNKTGALKLATETSGIAITIGHGTSEVTIGDNLTIAGNLTVTGTQTVVDTVTMNAANAIVFEGATADEHETTLTIVDPTADRTINLPNQSGTIPVLAAASNTAITSTPAELNILDGVSATTADLNLLDGVTATTAELNIIAGVTATTAELNIMDGGTSASSTSLADADRVVVNDAGTMKQVALTDFETYMETSLDTLANVTTVGALNAGSITSGFGAIDNGSSAITTTGTVTFGSLSDGSITVTAFVDEDDMSSNSATLVPTQQSVKAYVSTIAGQSNNIVGLTASAAELNILDNATVTTAELNILDGSATTQATVTLAGTDGVVISDADVMKQALVSDFDTYMASTSKTLTNKTLTSPVLDGTIVVSDGSNDFNIASHDGSNGLKLGGTLVTSSAAELNLIDGGTSRGTTAIASGDGILINDAGTMRMTNVDTVSTYFAGHNVGGANIVTTGALDTGSITSGFGTIDTGASAITTTGLISGGSLDIDNVLINGTTIGHTDDTDLITLANTAVTVAGSTKSITYQETYIAKSAASTVTCDLATGQHFSVTVSANTTFAFTNPPSSGTSYSFTLIVTQHSTAVTLGWPNTVDWAGGAAPAIAGNNEVQAYGFVTRDGGTTYYGFLGGTAIA